MAREKKDKNQKQFDPDRLADKMESAGTGKVVKRKKKKKD
jgi:hypothetical protein